jgi:hypothetical protein
VPDPHRQISYRSRSLRPSGVMMTIGQVACWTTSELAEHEEYLNR